MPVPLIVIGGAMVLKGVVGSRVYAAWKARRDAEEAQRIHDLTPVPEPVPDSEAPPAL